MSAWIAQVDNANPGTASMHNLQDSLRSTLGGGSVHIRAETEASARVMAAKVLGCRVDQVVVVPYNTGEWTEASGGLAQ